MLNGLCAVGLITVSLAMLILFGPFAALPTLGLAFAFLVLAGY